MAHESELLSEAQMFQLSGTARGAHWTAPASGTPSASGDGIPCFDAVAPWCFIGSLGSK